MTERPADSNALLSDVEARAQRRRLQTRDDQWQGLVSDAWHRGRAEMDAENLPEARRWLERATRLAPRDSTVKLSLATALLEDGAISEAASLFAAVASEHAVPDALSGLALCRHLQGDAGGAAEAVAQALQASVPTAGLRALADAVAPGAGAPGWCGLDGDGVLHTGGAAPDAVRLDGALVGLEPGNRLPPGWRTASLVWVECGGKPFLGSPLSVCALTQVEGFVEAHPDGAVTGWAWHPADPSRTPVLTVETSSGVSTTLADGEPPHDASGRPLARPRGFRLHGLADGPVSVRGADGRHLLGSPLCPGLEQRAAAGGQGPVWADVRGASPATGPRRPVDVVVPVYRGLHQTMACLHSVLATAPRGTRVHVVDDASPEPALVAALQVLHRQRRVRLIATGQNRGFPGAANAGLRACVGRDAVLLNSDTLVAPGWLERLRAAAYAAPDVGTATPLSNDATICSYPSVSSPNPIPDAAAVAGLDALAQAANGSAVVEVPTGVGFCLYIRADCLNQTGLLREDLFAQGYGEENDFCLRARHKGWRHVAALGVFVGHVGGQSFGQARAHLLRRNLRVLNRWHPGYDALVAAHVAADPLAPARRRMDALRWAEGRRKGAVVLVTHKGGGGVDRVVASRVAAIAAEGLRPVVLRPAPGGCVVSGDAYPNLRYRLPDELPELAALLRPDRVRQGELHHTLGHQPGITDLFATLRVPFELYVHDYASFCPRIALVSTNRRYCGEPDVAGCEACVADLGSLLEDPAPVPELLRRSAEVFGRSRRVVAPSKDAATRIRRHFPGAGTVVVPWEDKAWPPLAPAPDSPVRRVCVVGAIGVEKGLDVLLACARDARARRLPLEFVVAGYTADDTRLMDAGPVFVTGEFREEDAVALIRSLAAHLAFIPSVWPETWCYALSRAWEAGLAAVAFDLGTQAERIRAAGRGAVLPLGLQPGAVNDALLALPLAPGNAARQCPPQPPHHHQRVHDA